MSTANYIISRFDNEEKIFYLKKQNTGEDKIAVSCNIKLQGENNGAQKFVNTNLLLDDYACCRLLNPFLTAQSDVYKVRMKINDSDKTVGYIFPVSELENSQEEVEDGFDEAKQAYKYYCVKYIIENYAWDNTHEGPEINISSILNFESSYIIIYKPLLANSNFIYTDILPNLAIYGYYHFPIELKSNVSNLLSFSSNRQELDEIIKGRFLYVRGQQSIALKSSKNILDSSTLIKLLYEKLLTETDNPLYRFLILYQVIEFLVEEEFTKGLNNLISERSNYSNYKFLQQIHDLNNTRTVINKLFEVVSFDAKNEITNILRDFILEFESDYNKFATGDCFYDIRNLLFHDYKSILNKNKDGELVSLIILCEILIHYLVVSS